MPRNTRPKRIHSRSLDDWLHTGNERPGSNATGVPTVHLYAAAYINLKAAFDLVNSGAVFKLLEITNQKEIPLFCGLYIVTFSCVRCRVVHGSDGPAGRVGSGRVGSGRVGSGWVGSRFCRILAGRVGSALRIFKYFTDYFFVPESIWIDMNRYESSNTVFGLIDFLRYLIYNI
jgi:hypothetical protein